MEQGGRVPLHMLPRRCPSLKIVLTGLERCDLTPKITFQVWWSFPDMAKSVPAAYSLFQPGFQ